MSVETPEGAKTPIDCCPPVRDPRIATHFDYLTRQRTAKGVLPPMQPTTRRLFALLEDVGQVRPTVLELGCGTGALLVALLASGATRADGIDLSPGSLDAARRRAQDAGVVDRTALQEGDAARIPLTPHDWVVMDRVICCYPDMEALLDNAIPTASQRIAFSVPTSRGLRGLLNRSWWGLEARWANVRKGPCPGYVHSLDLIEGRLSDAGFRLLRNRTGWMWYLAVWERPA